MRVSLLIFAMFSTWACASDVTPAVLSAPGGRFVFGQINGMARDQYMLDTKTGQLWHIVADEHELLYLETIHYREFTGKSDGSYCISEIPIEAKMAGPAAPAAEPAKPVWKMPDPGPSPAQTSKPSANQDAMRKVLDDAERDAKAPAK